MNLNTQWEIMLVRDKWHHIGFSKFDHFQTKEFELTVIIYVICLRVEHCHADKTLIEMECPWSGFLP